MTPKNAASELTLFTSTAESFLRRDMPLSRVRDLHAEGISFTAEWWRHAAELGWASLLVPDTLGGANLSGDGVKDLALLATLTGRTVAPGPLHPVNVVLAGLCDAADAYRHSALIEALVAGEVVASWAVYEPAGASWSPLNPTVSATRVGTRYRIDGVKDRVEAADNSALLLVVTNCQGAPQQFLVPTDAPGVTVQSQRSIDLVKSYARVHFEGVEVDADNAVGTVEQTTAMIARQSQIAVVLQCAEMVGILDTVLGFTIEWARDRHTFGRPLASYQALKHQFADMKIWLEACNATTAAAVAAVGARAIVADTAVSVAKSYVAEQAPKIIQQCIQLHGGIGVTWEHDLHLYLRRVTLYRSMFGTPEEHNQRVYRLAGVSEGAAR